MELLLGPLLSGDVMRLRIKNILGRWRERRIRTKRIRKDYRTYARNRATLEKGGTLWDERDDSGFGRYY